MFTTRYMKALNSITIITLTESDIILTYIKDHLAGKEEWNFQEHCFLESFTVKYE